MDEDDDDNFVRYMNSFPDVSESCENEENPDNEAKIESELLLQELKDYFGSPGLSTKAKDSEVRQFWIEKKVQWPRCYELWVALQAVPVSEASVERLFSALHYIVNEYRNRLNEDTINNILLVRCNNVQI